MTRRVLLVEDHAVVRGGLARVLKSGGWDEVGEAADASQARSLASSQGPWQLAIIDAALGEEDGVALVAELRRLDRALPLMILSMHSDPGLVRAAVRAGANGFVIKEALPEEVVAASQALRFGGFYLDPRVAPTFLNSPSSDEPEDRRGPILAAVLEGLSNQETARRLNLSVSSVKAELRALFQSYGVKDRNGLLARLELDL